MKPKHDDGPLVADSRIAQIVPVTSGSSLRLHVLSLLFSSRNNFS